MNIPYLDLLLKAALAEDAPQGDVTSLAIVPKAAMAKARLIARKPGVAAGLPVFARAFQLADKRVRVRLKIEDGKAFKPGALLAEVSGPARALLLAERVALNYLQRLSGIATLTAAFVHEARGTRAKILDTRKTTPLMRALEKYAVACGGGVNHRMNLSDAILIKDNHVRLCGSPGEAVRRARAAYPKMSVEVEVESLAELESALDARPDIVLLDNMSVAGLKRAVARIRRAGPRRPLSEISGGVTLRSARRYARLGVDRISIGAITHSAPALDLSLEFL